jgi:hypothetical protein
MSTILFFFIEDRPKHFGSKIFIPSYSEDKLLDPKRAIYYYLKKTETLRNSDDNVGILNEHVS